MINRSLGTRSMRSEPARTSFLVAIRDRRSGSRVRNQRKLHTQVVTRECRRPECYLCRLRSAVFKASLFGTVVNTGLPTTARCLAALVLHRAIAGHAIAVAVTGNGCDAAPPFSATEVGVIAVTAVDRYTQPYAEANRRR
jgi:hypothetical protein